MPKCAMLNVWKIILAPNLNIHKCAKLAFFCIGTSEKAGAGLYCYNTGWMWGWCQNAMHNSLLHWFGFRAMFSTLSEENMYTKYIYYIYNRQNISMYIYQTRIVLKTEYAKNDVHIQCTILKCAICIVQCTLCNVQCTMYNVRCAIFIRERWLESVLGQPRPTL